MVCLERLQNHPGAGRRREGAPSAPVVAEIYSEMLQNHQNLGQEKTLMLYKE